MSPLMIIAAQAMRKANPPTAPAAPLPPPPPPPPAKDDNRTSHAIQVEPSAGSERRRRR